jgi:hypothetical protein
VTRTVLVGAAAGLAVAVAITVAVVVTVTVGLAVAVAVTVAVAAGVAAVDSVAGDLPAAPIPTPTNPASAGTGIRKRLRAQRGAAGVTGCG